MKKLLFLFLFGFCLLFAGCGSVPFTAHVDEVRFSFPEEYQQYFPYQGIPSYTLHFPGLTLRTNDNASTENKLVFGKNDDFAVSTFLAEFFAGYASQGRISYRLLSEDFAPYTKMNHLKTDDRGELYQESVSMPVYNDTVYNEIAYITTETGLNLSIEYRRFQSESSGTLVTYYSWRYTVPLNAVFHYPLYVRKNEQGNKELLLIPLPDQVIYHLGVNEKTPVSVFLKEDRYMDVYYRMFLYPGYSEDPSDQEEFNREESIRTVKAFYEKYFDLKETAGIFTFSYLGITYQLTFLEQNFQIDYLGKA